MRSTSGCGKTTARDRRASTPMATTSCGSRRTASMYRGVAWDKSKGKWAGKIKVDYETENLGTFDTQEEAAEAFDERAWQLNRGTNFRLDGTLNNLGLGASGKVVPKVRTELWTSKLSRQSA